MQTSPRLLPLVGAYNFRDLGGYPTIDGRATRWGRLFRSDTLHELTKDDLVTLRAIGLASVIDLRSTIEVERSGRGLLEDEPVRYLHLPVLEDGGSEVQAAFQGEDLADHYLDQLTKGRIALVRALGVVGDRTRYPLVFHCSAGKDRTGVLAALVLDILGVSRETIVEDYVITATRMELIMARLGRDQVFVSRMSQLPGYLFSVEAGTMEKFLNLLYERHGGGHEWALAAGVSSQTLDAMSALLVAADFPAEPQL